MKRIAVIDIDTTIANNDHRASLLVPDANGDIPQRQWDQFLVPELILQDTIQPYAAEGIDYLRRSGYYIVFLTGRNSTLRDVTKRWLQEHVSFSVSTDLLYMRPVRHADVPASVCKENILLEYIRRMRLVDETTSFLFFEDDPYVINVWRKYGVVLRCPEAWENLYHQPPRDEEPSWRR